MRKRTLGFLILPVAILGFVAACTDDEEPDTTTADAGPDAKGDSGGLADTGTGDTGTKPDSTTPYVPNPVVIGKGFKDVPESFTFEAPEMVAALPNDAGWGTVIPSLSAMGRIGQIYDDAGYGYYAAVPTTIQWNNPLRAVGVERDPAGGAYLAVGVNNTLDGGQGVNAAHPARGIYHSLDDGGMVRVDQGPPANEYFGWLTAIENIGPDMYIADAINGSILKMNRSTGAVTLWYKDAMLKGKRSACADAVVGGATVQGPQDFGAYALEQDANGSALFVGNHDYGAIIRIPINNDGSAGTAAVVLQGLLNGGTDCSHQGIKGIVRDDDGSFYFTNQITHKIYHAKDATFTNPEIFLEGRPPFDQPSGLYLDRNGATGQRRLLVANQAVIARNTDAGPNPTIIAIELP